MIKTFICNYKPLEQRLVRVHRELNDKTSISLQDRIIIQNEPSRLEVREFYDNLKPSWKTKTDMPHYRDIPWRILKMSEISLAYKHCYAYDMMNKDFNDEYYLVLEDDIILTDDFEKILRQLICFNEEESDIDPWDVVFLGGCCPIKSKLQSFGLSNGEAWLVDHPASRCTDAYLLTKQAATLLNYGVIPFTLPIDFELSYAFKQLKMKVWHLENPIVSHNPDLQSSIQG